MIIFLIAGGVIAVGITCLNRPQVAPVTAVDNTSVAQSAPADSPKTTSPAPVSQPPAQPVASVPATAPAPAAVETPAGAPVNPITKAVDSLLSAKSGKAKNALLRQLVLDGQIDQVIAELQQRAAANPNDPEIPTTTGEAMLNKLRALYEANGGPSGPQNNDEIGILAMQADQQFDAALKIDPQNWEAQFVKSSAQYYWPANPQTDNDTVQRLSSLIDQQDSMAAQPDFAQTYVVLGNEYVKIGQPEKAYATWQLGLSKFPNSGDLQQKVGSAAN